MEKLRFIQGSDRHGFMENAHVTAEADAAGPRQTLCGKRMEGTVLHEADWEALHYRTPFGGVCEKCFKTAELRLRPKAKYWYLDPFNGDMKEFDSLREAVAAARKEHGNPWIYQTGPGNINKNVRQVEGLPMLP